LHVQPRGDGYEGAKGDIYEANVRSQKLKEKVMSEILEPEGSAAYVHHAASYVTGQVITVDDSLTVSAL
jgi:hypothetical protein